MDGRAEQGGRFSVATWNINGIRSAKDLRNMLDSLDADIVCIQETKITREMLTEPVAIVSGYSSYFDFCERRSGYSGVATYVRARATPEAAEAGVAGSRECGAAKEAVGSVGHYGQMAALATDRQQRSQLDAEGRCMVTVHRLSCMCRGLEAGPCRLAILNVYCPRVDPDRPERLEYKMLFYGALRARAQALIGAGYHVLVAGDLNCTHRTIDTCDPAPPQEFASNPSRQFLTSWLVPPDAGGAAGTEVCTWPDSRLVDTYRHLYPSATEVYTCWNTQKAARQCNYGTRIDYILSDQALIQQLQQCEVMAHVLGSDHCPVRAEWRGRVQPAPTPPPACTRWYPELAGKQQTLKELCAKLPTKQPTVQAVKVGTGAGTMKANGKRRKVESKVARSGKSSRGQVTLLSFFKVSAAVKTYSVSEASEELSDSLPHDSAADFEESAGEHSQISASEETSVASFAMCDTIYDLSNQGSNSSSEFCMRQAVINPLADTGRSADGSGTAAEYGGAARAASFWRQALRGRRAPVCHGHQQPCVLRTVKKTGPNLGRNFWCCARGVGKQGDPQARCDHFQWAPR